MSVPEPDPTSARVLRVVVLSLPIFLVLCVTAFLATVLTAWVNGTSLLDRRSLLIGILCGLIIWMFVGLMHLKRESVLVPVPRRGGLLGQLQAQIEALGYCVVDRWDNGFACRAGFQSFLLGGGIEVQLEPYALRLTGPKLYIEGLRSRLQAHTSASMGQDPSRHVQRRPGEPLLQRVEISMRVPLDQWLALYDEVIDVLAREDAEVVCDVQIVAQSKLGIRDSTIETRVRDWLKQQHVQAEVRTEAAGMAPQPANREGPVA